MTIADINTDLSYARNTITKYLDKLEENNKVQHKFWGRNKVYQLSDRSLIPRNIIRSFIKGAFSSLKNKFPNLQGAIKEIGKDIAKYLYNSTQTSLLEELGAIKKTQDPNLILKSFEDYYLNFDFFQNSIDLNLIKLDNIKKRAVYRFSNSEFIGATDDYIYYFYAMCGVIEGFAKEYFNSEVICEVEEVNISPNEEDSYLDISIQLK